MMKRGWLVILAMALGGCDQLVDIGDLFDHNNDTDSDKDTEGKDTDYVPDDTDTVPNDCEYRNDDVCKNGTSSWLLLEDSQNYAYTSKLGVRSTVVRGGNPLVDLKFNWGDVSHDYFGNAVDPLNDVDMVLVSLWNVTQDRLASMIANNSLEMSRLLGAITAYPEGRFTGENLLGFTSFGDPIDESDLTSYFNPDDPSYDPRQFTHMLSIHSDENGLFSNMMMMQFFTLDSNSENIEVNLTDASTNLTYSVDLRSLKRIPIAVNDPMMKISWEYLVQNSMGQPFVPTMIDRVVVARYSMSACDLESNFMNYQNMADKWYETDLDTVGLHVDLGLLTADDGAHFEGVDADGLWIVALLCTSQCTNPAPLFLSVLEAC